MAIEFKVNIDDTYINVIKFGKGSKNVLLLPGIFLTGFEKMGDTLESIYNLFTNDFTFYFMDERKSFNVNEYSIKEMADDIYYVCKELKLNCVYIYGISIGAMIGQCLAFKYPKFVKKLAICSSMCKTTKTMYDTAIRWIEIASNNDVVSLNRDFNTTVCSNEYYEKFKDAFIANETKGTNKDCERFIILCKSLLDFNIENEMKNIECDVIAIGDINDKVISIEGTKEIINILKCENKIFDKYSHAVYDECEDVKTIIYNFFIKD